MNWIDPDGLEHFPFDGHLRNWNNQDIAGLAKKQLVDYESDRINKKYNHQLMKMISKHGAETAIENIFGQQIKLTLPKSVIDSIINTKEAEAAKTDCG